MCDQIIQYLSQTRFFAALEHNQLKEIAAEKIKGSLPFSK